MRFRRTPIAVATIRLRIAGSHLDLIMIDPFAPPPIDPDSFLVAMRKVRPLHCRCTPEGNRKALEELQASIRAALDEASRRTVERN